MLEYTLKSQLMYESKRIIIWENETHFVTTSTIPHVDKYDGGHIVVRLKKSVKSITELNDNSLLELFKIVRACEKALLELLNEQGIETPFTNNMDNGNWAIFANKDKSLHIHIYGRAVDSIKQTFGQALYFPDPHTTFYDHNKPLSDDDIIVLKEKITTYYR